MTGAKQQQSTLRVAGRLLHGVLYLPHFQRRQVLDIMSETRYGLSLCGEVVKTNTYTHIQVDRYVDSLRHLQSPPVLDQEEGKVVLSHL